MKKRNNTNNEIKLVNTENFNCSEHVCRLINAILNVNEEYLTYPEKGYNVDKNDKYNIEQIERVFAYELYHQWSLLKDKNLILNGEPGKLINNTDYKYPDMVLHGGQGDGEHNKIAVEIKRSLTANNTNIANDLKKLSQFLKKKEYEKENESQSAKNEAKWKNYENAVFILFGTDMKKISKALKFSKQTKTQKYKNIDSDIICITYNYYGKKNADKGNNDNNNMNTKNKYVLEIARIKDLDTKTKVSHSINGSISEVLQSLKKISDKKD